MTPSQKILLTDARLALLLDTTEHHNQLIDTVSTSGHMEGDWHKLKQASIKYASEGGNRYGDNGLALERLIKVCDPIPLAHQIKQPRQGDLLCL